MIEKKRRISRILFPHPSTKKIVFNGKALMMAFYPIYGATHSYFSVVASKKIFKNSVNRNYFKRVIYDVVKKNEKKFDIKFKGLIIFSSKKDGLNYGFSQLRDEIIGFLN